MDPSHNGKFLPSAVQSSLSIHSIIEFNDVRMRSVIRGKSDLLTDTPGNHSVETLRIFRIVAPLNR